MTSQSFIPETPFPVAGTKVDWGSVFVESNTYTSFLLSGLYDWRYNSHKGYTVWSFFHLHYLFICLLPFLIWSLSPGHPFTYSIILFQVCQCPLCKKTFQNRPDLQINRTLREITDQFKSVKGGGSVKHNKGKKMGHKNNNFMAELKMKLPKPLPKNMEALTGTAQSQGK